LRTPSISLQCSMTTTSIQDRTNEFRSVLAHVQKRQAIAKVGGQRQSLLSDTQRREASGSPNGEAKGTRRGARSEFARRAAEIGRGITGTMAKLERLAQCRWFSIQCRCDHEIGKPCPSSRRVHTMGQRRLLFQGNACASLNSH